MFRASLRPSSVGQTAFSLYMVICPVVTCDVGESAGKLCALCGVGLLIKDARSLEHKVQYYCYFPKSS